MMEGLFYTRWFKRGVEEVMLRWTKGKKERERER